MEPTHPEPAALLFVYGTLKEGFPNHGLNRGRRLPGEYRTRVAYPLYVVRLPNEERAPWLMDLPGHGHPVTGQVFEVPQGALASMDAFEEVGQPTGYVRVEVEIEPAGPAVPAVPGCGPLRAFSYMKPVSQWPRCLAVEGPFAEYTRALADGYRLSPLTSP